MNLGKNLNLESGQKLLAYLSSVKEIMVIVLHSILLSFELSVNIKKKTKQNKKRIDLVQIFKPLLSSLPLVESCISF